MTNVSNLCLWQLKLRQKVYFIEMMIEFWASANRSFYLTVFSSDICSKNTPTLLLSDICDASTTNVCEKIFDFVEDRISTWKSVLFRCVSWSLILILKWICGWWRHFKAQFTDSCRVNLLRMCNDLLRRLSRAVDVGFCGRILVFLAKCLPLTEKSGNQHTVKTTTLQIANVFCFRIESDQPVQQWQCHQVWGEIWPFAVLFSNQTWYGGRRNRHRVHLDTNTTVLWDNFLSLLF